ncbi:hypothetical protein Tco_0870547, partial [Tanacetum coccineum]
GEYDASTYNAVFKSCRPSKLLWFFVDAALKSQIGHSHLQQKCSPLEFGTEHVHFGAFGFVGEVVLYGGRTDEGDIHDIRTAFKEVTKKMNSEAQGKLQQAFIEFYKKLQAFSGNHIDGKASEEDCELPTHSSDVAPTDVVPSSQAIEKTDATS